MQRFRTIVAVSLLFVLVVGCIGPTTTPVAPTAMPQDTPVPEQTPTVAPTAIAEGPQVVMAWEFAAEGNALRWSPTNDLSRFSVDSAGLHTRATGGDPYMVGPAIDLDAAAAPYLEIRLRSTLGTDAQVFWEREEKQFNEADSLHLAVTDDGEWHTYRVAVKNVEGWQGSIRRLRLDPSNVAGGTIDVAYIRAVGPLPATLEARTFGTTSAIVAADEPFDLTAVLANAGDLALEGATLDLQLPVGMELVEGSQSMAIETLTAGLPITTTWSLRAGAGVYALALRSGEQTLCQTDVIVESQDDEEPLTLGGSDLALSFARQPFGYGVGTLRWREGETWRTVGRLRSLGQIRYLDSHDQPHSVLLYADEGTLADDTLAFTAHHTDEDGAVWTSQIVFSLSAAFPWIELSYQLSADRPVRLLAWSGPEYLAGEGAFGAERDSGLFPGLEYLLGDERSSGTDYADATVSARYVPHPNKITIPLMAINQDGMTTGLLWDPLQSWDGAHDRPAALYASPNTWEGQANHLMRLFVPGMTAGLAENNDQLGEPYALAADTPLQLTARLFVAVAADPLAPLDVWLLDNGLPGLPSAPRTYDEASDLALRAFTETAWDSQSGGWHAVLHDPWGPGSNVAVETQLWIASLNPGLDAATKAQWREMVERALLNATAVGSPTPWYYSVALGLHMASQSVDPRSVRDTAYGERATQRADGSWPYTPSATSGRPFGQAGDTSSGWVATHALPLLFGARVTGDPDLIKAGLRALDYLETLPLRPEGAQTWELSLHVPDLLASAWVSQCFVEGYRLTGDVHYLDVAQRWAYSGLPFIYLWNAPDRAIMRYASIPVFGASNYSYPWFGRPVMWNGLDYAIGLQQLADEVEASGTSALVDWRRVAEGITVATLQMQASEGAYTGMYPDAWDVVTGREAYSWWLIPTYLEQAILLLQGHEGAQVRTIVLGDEEQQVRVSTVARVLEARLEDDTLVVRLAYYPGEATELFVSPLRSTPQEVVVNDHSLAENGAWEAPEGAWNWSRRMVLVRVPCEDTEAEVRITLQPE